MATYITKVIADNSPISVGAGSFSTAGPSSVLNMTPSVVQLMEPGFGYVDYFGSFSYTYSGGFQYLSWPGSTLTGITTYDPNRVMLDTIYGLSIPGSVYETFANNNDAVGLVAYFFSGNDTITGSAFNDVLWGYAGNDLIWAGDGNDILDGGLGNDILSGQLGNDIYRFSGGQDFLNENGLTAPSLDVLDMGLLLPSSVIAERRGLNLILSVQGSNDSVTASNYFSDAWLEEIRFADGTVWTPTQFQTLISIIDGTAFQDNLNGSQWISIGVREQLSGMGGNDTLHGYDADDILIGGTGNDYVDGGRGNDTYIFNAGDGRDTLFDEVRLGYDTINPQVSDADQLLLQGILPGDVTLGRSIDDLIISFAGSRDSITINRYFETATVAGGTYGPRPFLIETIRFSDGTVWDASYIDSLNLRSIIRGTPAGDYYISGGNTPDWIYGLGGSDMIFGGGGDDYLDGGAGDDWLFGGAGNNISYFGRGYGSDVVTPDQRSNGEFDTIQFAASIAPSDISVIRISDYTGADLVFKIKGTTNAIGISGFFSTQQVLDLSTMNWTTVWATDIRVQFADGTIWDRSMFNDLPLVGTAAGDSLNGSDMNDIIRGLDGGDWLYGFSGDDYLDGGLGADWMIDYEGNDTFIVDNVGDMVDERSTLGSEIDTVKSSVNWLLGANLDNLFLTGIAAINGSGNTLNNTLTGNAAANILGGLEGNDILSGLAGNDTLDGGAGDDLLNGGAGVDNMAGGLGNDTYIVDNASDITTETSTLATEIDTVQSLVTRTLGANIENLTLTGAAAINGSGNMLNNTLIGNAAGNILNGYAGNDILDGGAGDDLLNGGLGIDRMTGGTGNDTYVVNVAGDITTETSTLLTEIDTVESSVTWTLGANLENLVLTGGGVTNGTGNALNNMLTGNTAANVLVGYAGNDILNGGAGDDNLYGGLGNDTYLFGRTGGLDRITDTGGADVLALDADVSFDQLWFRHVANDLEVGIIGTGDTVTISNWYLGAKNGVEQIQAGGMTLSNANVENLVQAMAAFAPPSAGQTILPPAYQTTLNPVITANWV